MSCSGRGCCFEQTGSGPSGYDDNHRYLDCDKGCTLQKCPNFEYCGEILPQWVIDCHHGRCFNCNLTFNKDLTFIDNIECPICLDVKRGVQRVNCLHYSCIECFKESFRNSFFPPPEHPYSDDEEHPDDDPLIIQYNNRYDEWEHREEIEYEKRNGLRSCPICRRSEIKNW